MKPQTLMKFFRFGWSALEHYQQALSWADAAEARQARLEAEALAAARLEEMLDANPSGQLGNSQLNDANALRKADLL